MVVRADKAENRYRIVQWLLNLGNVLERIQKAESVQRRKKKPFKSKLHCAATCCAGRRTPGRG